MLQDEEIRSGAWNWARLEATAQELHQCGKLPRKIPRPSATKSRPKVTGGADEVEELEALSDFELMRYKNIKRNQLALEKIRNQFSNSNLPLSKVKNEAEEEAARVEAERKRILRLEKKRTLQLQVQVCKKNPGRGAKKPLPR